MAPTPRSGHTNIIRLRKSRRFMVVIRPNKKPKYIGIYDTLPEAIEARDAGLLESRQSSPNFFSEPIINGTSDQGGTADRAP